MNSLLAELRKIPMMPLVLAISTGILIALHFDLAIKSTAWICVILFGVAVFSVVLFRNLGIWIAVTLLFIVAVGTYRANLSLDRATRNALSALSKSVGPVSVSGYVDWPVSDSPRHNHVLLRRCSVEVDSLRVLTSTSGIRIFADSACLAGARYGDMIHAVGGLAAGQDLYSTRGTLAGALTNRVAASLYADSTSLFISRREITSWRRMVDAARDYARSVFGARLSSDGSALCNALLLGDRGEFGREFSHNLRLTGLSHIFALSGMNTGLIVLVVWACICWIPIPHTGRLLILLGAVLFYMEIGRNAPSLVRASLVAVAIIAGHLLHRRAAFLNLVFAAAFCELLWKPLDIVDAGFLLSYFAVFGIIGAYPWLRSYLLGVWKHPGIVWRALANIGAGTGAAQIATMPIVGYLFHRIPLIGITGNLLVIPGFAFLLVLALLLLVVHPFLTFAAEIISSAVDGVSWGLGSIVNISASLPLASLPVIPLNSWAVWVLSASAVVLLIGLSYRRMFWVIGGILISANTLVWSHLATPNPSVCVASFIDVENGDATLISAGDKNVLIDAGPAYGGWSAAIRVLPLLSERSVDRLDALILTHPDNDHIGGAVDLLLKIPVETVYLNGADEVTRTTVEIELAAASQRCKRSTLTAGDVLRLSTDVRLAVLHPDSAGLVQETIDNRQSLVVRLDADGSSALLPGDIDSVVEADLADWGSQLDVDLLKIAHHGARSSTSSAFLDSTTPHYCVISSGQRNYFGHPAPETLDRIARRDIALFSTADEGTITFAVVQGHWQKVESDVHRLARRWKLPT